MKKSIASLLLLTLVVVFTLTAMGGFILAMIEKEPKLLVFALAIAAGAVAMFVVHEVKAVNAEQRKVEEFMAHSRANDPYTVKID